MTIGVAAAGGHAGAAVYEAVLAAELLGRGAIGGFAVFAVLDAAGKLAYRWTQRDGVSSLDLPAEWRDAPFAAIISSGPDRPEPLTQFLAGADGVGLVTGHRLPNQAGHDGRALNQAVLDAMAQGIGPQQAVDTVLDAHAEWDAGLLAINSRADIGWGNSQRVRRRDDLGSFHRAQDGASLALLHNSIYARGPLAAQLGEMAWARLTGADAPWQRLSLQAPIVLRSAAQDRVDIDDDGVIIGIATANPRLAGLNRRGTVVYLNTEIWRGGLLAGHAMTELYVEARDGLIHPATSAAQNGLLMRSGDVAA